MVTQAFDREIRPTLGYPANLVTDQDPLFMSSHFQEWAKSHGINHVAGSTYYPATDGQTEVQNKHIIEAVREKTREGYDWVTASGLVQTELNARYDSSRKQAPFFALYGFNPRLGPSILPHPIPLYTPHKKKHQEVSENLYQAKLKQKEQADKHRRPAPLYYIGDKV